MQSIWDNVGIVWDSTTKGLEVDVVKPFDLTELLDLAAKADQVHGLCLTQCRDVFTKRKTAETALDAVEALSKVEVLDLTSCSTVDESMLVRMISRKPKLTQLRLSFVRNVTDEAMCEVGKLLQLKYLDLESCQVTCAGTVLLPQLPQLMVLNLARTTVGDACMTAIGQVASLRHLRLKSCKQLTDDGLADLAELELLCSLDLENCENLTDKGLMNLLGKGKLKSLKALDLSNCTNIELTRPELRPAFSGLPALDTLRLRGCTRVSDESLACVSLLQGLRELDLGLCGEITDDGLSHAAGLKNLRTINLNLCKKVTDRGLQTLCDLPALTDVHLGWCVNVSEEGIQALSRSGPGRVNVLERSGKSMRIEDFQVPS